MIFILSSFGAVCKHQSTVRKRCPSKYFTAGNYRRRGLWANSSTSDQTDI